MRQNCTPATKNNSIKSVFPAAGDEQESTNIKHSRQEKSPATSDKSSRGRFAKSSNAFRHRPDTTSNDVAMLDALREHTDLYGVCWARNETIAEELGLKSKETVRSRFAAMNRRGHIWQWTQKNHPRANVFRVPYDEVERGLYLFSNPTYVMRQMTTPEERQEMYESLANFFSAEGPGISFEETEEAYAEFTKSVKMKREEKRKRYENPLVPGVSFSSNPATKKICTGGVNSRAAPPQVNAPYNQTDFNHTYYSYTLPNNTYTRTRTREAGKNGGERKEEKGKAMDKRLPKNDSSKLRAEGLDPSEGTLDSFAKGLQALKKDPRLAKPLYDHYQREKTKIHIKLPLGWALSQLSLGFVRLDEEELKVDHSSKWEEINRKRAKQISLQVPGNHCWADTHVLITGNYPELQFSYSQPPHAFEQAVKKRFEKVGITIR